MTLSQFNALPGKNQLATVNETGLHLATRWQKAVLLLRYYLPGEALAEVSYDTMASYLTGVRVFTNLAPLAACAVIMLPQGTSGAERVACP